MAAKAEGVYIADTESFVTKQMDKLDFDYGGIPGDLHFGLTKSGAREPMFSRGTEIFNRRQISIVSIEECDEIALKWECRAFCRNGSVRMWQSAAYLILLH